MPGVKSVAIEKDYENRKIVVRISEREPYGIWCDVESGLSPESGECRWFDKDGVVFKEALFAKGAMITAVSDYSENDIISPFEEGFMLGYLSA